MHPAKSEVGWSAFASDHLEDFPHRPEDQFSAEVVFVSILLLETLSPQIMCRWFPRLNFTVVLIALAKNLKDSSRFITTCSLSRQWKEQREKQEFARETSAALPSGSK